MLTFSIILAIFCFLSKEVHATSVMLGTNYTFADPSGIYSRSDKKYYAYSTGYSIAPDGTGFPVGTSEDGETFKLLGNALSQKPNWSDGTKYWAPDVVYNPKTKQYVMSYTAGDKTKDFVELRDKNGKAISRSGGQTIGIATSIRASGGFIPQSKPMIDRSINSFNRSLDFIDSSIFVDNNNQAYLIYKVEFVNDETAVHYGAIGANRTYGEIHAQALNDSWTGYKKGSKAVVLMKSTEVILPRDRVWGGLNHASTIEAPYMTKAPDGTYVLFFSGNTNDELGIANNVNSGIYYTGYAISKNPFSTFKNQGAFMTTQNMGLNAPGGFSLMKRADGDFEGIFMSIDKAKQTVAQYNKEKTNDLNYQRDIKLIDQAHGVNPWRLHEVNFGWKNGHRPVFY